MSRDGEWPRRWILVNTGRPSTDIPNFLFPCIPSKVEAENNNGIFSLSASFSTEIKGKSGGKASGKVIFFPIKGGRYPRRGLFCFLLVVTVVWGADIWSYDDHFTTEKARKWPR